ncbi:hypothetical protein [Kitasatospora sp. NPDC093679]|uniref:hypothetical protein n=1 Tax=Kitasatospora sp. NPDC093679 TaxID=3154983 RepID=UPI00342A2A38
MPASAGASAVPAGSAGQDRCSAMINGTDLPDGYDRTVVPDRCNTDGELTTTGFKGLNGPLEHITEQIEVAGSAEKAVARFPEMISELGTITPQAKEVSADAFRDLGDEERYFTEHEGQTTWNVLCLRRGKIVMYLDVVKTGAPFTAEDLHRLAATAVRRAASLG